MARDGLMGWAGIAWPIDAAGDAARAKRRIARPGMRPAGKLTIEDRLGGVTRNVSIWTDNL
jgi:hypothetical protein